MKHILCYFILIIFVCPVKGQDVIKPNIIIFYADDLGWQDTELNDEGTPVPWETPNMLSLADNGAMFTQAYSPAPTCAPSRTAMMSGKHPVKTKMTHVSGGQIPVTHHNNITTDKLIHPYFPGRLQLEETSIAEALSPFGYVSGHIGKWHMAFKNNAYPDALAQGFDYQYTGRGITRSMNKRWEGYATDAEDDDYKIDEDGRPYDAVTEEALAFMENNKSEPFFLYMATWLVHAPIQTRDLALLTYYCNKLGIDVPTEDVDITTKGQSNPYYGAMVASLDWSLGKVVDYLEATDDPRNPGKKLVETTYIIFASDNGGAETKGKEIITDNYPLDKGKANTKEGGVRTPLVIAGPGISTNVFDNVATHLDFYPTILSLTGATLSNDLFEDLDGVDLTPLLKEESTILEDANGNERTDLFWHFPHADDSDFQSAIRSGNYKLYKNYADGGSYEAYQLYNADGSNNDLEEQFNIINMIPDAEATEMINKLETFLSSNDARLPTWNSDYAGDDAPLANQSIVPEVSSVNYNQDKNTVTATVTNTLGEAEISSAILLYKINGDDESDEWFESSATVNSNIITADVPENATGVVFNLIDENNFLVLSEETVIADVNQIKLNGTDSDQLFGAAVDFSELLPNTTVNGTAIYLQNKIIGGGAKYSVKVDEGVESAVCDRIEFRVRSQEGDTVGFDISVGGETQNFVYTSTKTSTNKFVEFNTPVTFTEVAQELEVITTALSHATLIPRFRIYDITFHLSEIILGIDDIDKGNNKNLNIYPNPTKDTFSLTDEVESGVLYNISGAKVFEFENKYEDINISNLRSGLYLLEVINKDGNKNHFKLLKE